LWVTDITEHPTREGKVYPGSAVDEHIYPRRRTGRLLPPRRGLVDRRLPDRGAGHQSAYLALLSTILNAAVDSDYLSRSPMRRKSQAGRAEAVTKNGQDRRFVP
jgi:hypothetical protein